MDDLTVRAEALSKKVEVVINNLAELTGETNRQRLVNLLESLDKLAKRVERIAAQNEREIRNAVRGAGTAAQALVELMQAARAAVEDARGSVRKVSDAAIDLLSPKRVEDVAADVKATLKDTRSTLAEAKAKLGEKGIGATIARLDRFIKKAAGFIAKAQLTLNQTREGIYAAVQNLVEASENFKDFSRE